jgi:hypothetical protein
MGARRPAAMGSPIMSVATRGEVIAEQSRTDSESERLKGARPGHLPGQGTHLFSITKEGDEVRLAIDVDIGVLRSAVGLATGADSTKR